MEQCWTAAHQYVERNIIYYRPSKMSVQQRAKHKAQRITKQSIALLQKLKSKKEQQAIPPNQENYIEDLYLKIFNKCSPHFDKMITSNEILVEYKNQTKIIEESKQECEQVVKQNSELKGQLAKLMQSQDNTGKMKTLNIQLNKLEQVREENAMLIKTLKKENQGLADEMQQLRQQYEKANQLNAELEEFVEKITHEMQFSHNQIDEKNYQQLKNELQNISGELLRSQKMCHLLSAENKDLKTSLQQAVRDYQCKLEQQLSKIHEEHWHIINQNNEKLSIYESQHKSSQNSLLQAHEQIDFFKDKLATLQQAKGKVEVHISSITLENEILNANIEDYKEQLRQKEQQKHLREEQAIKLCQLVKNSSQNAERLQFLLDSSSQTNLKLTTRNLQLEQQLVDLGNKLARNEEELMGKIEELKERLKFFKENNDTLNNQKIDLINNIEILAEEARSITAELQQKEQQIKQLRERHSGIAALKNQTTVKEQQFEIKLDETVQYYEKRLEQRQKACCRLKDQQETHQSSFNNKQQQYVRQIQSLKQSLIGFERSLSASCKQQGESRLKIKDQQERVEKLSLQKHEQQSRLTQRLQQALQEISAQKAEILQLKERLALNKEEKDHLSQQKIALKEENQKNSEINNKLHTEVNDKKIKIQKNEQKISELNEIINGYQNNIQADAAPKQILKKKGSIPQIEEKPQSKCNKHIQTINELSSQLTEAYKMIQDLEHTISQLKTRPQQKNDKQQKSSVQKRQRGRSMKKIAGIFGF